MEIDDKELTFKRVSDKEALSSLLRPFNCGVREIDLLIHKKTEGGLKNFILHNECDTFLVYSEETVIATFVFSDGTLHTEDGDYTATEIDFIAVREDYREQGVGTKILEKISEISRQNGVSFLMADAFSNNRYSAEDFYLKNGFKKMGELQNKVIPMFKEL